MFLLSIVESMVTSQESFSCPRTLQRAGTKRKNRSDNLNGTTKKADTLKGALAITKQNQPRLQNGSSSSSPNATTPNGSPSVEGSSCSPPSRSSRASTEPLESEHKGLLYSLLKYTEVGGQPPTSPLLSLNSPLSTATRSAEQTNSSSVSPMEVEPTPNGVLNSNMPPLKPLRIDTSLTSDATPEPSCEILSRLLDEPVDAPYPRAQLNRSGQSGKSQSAPRRHSIRPKMGNETRPPDNPGYPDKTNCRLRHMLDDGLDREELEARMLWEYSMLRSAMQSNARRRRPNPDPRSGRSTESLVEVLRHLVRTQSLMNGSAQGRPSTTSGQVIGSQQSPIPTAGPVASNLVSPSSGSSNGTTSMEVDATSETRSVQLARKLAHHVQARISEYLRQSAEFVALAQPVLRFVQSGRAAIHPTNNEETRSNQQHWLTILCHSWHRLLALSMAEHTLDFVVVETSANLLEEFGENADENRLGYPWLFIPHQRGRNSNTTPPPMLPDMDFANDFQRFLGDLRQVGLTEQEYTLLRHVMLMTAHNPGNIPTIGFNLIQNARAVTNGNNGTSVMNRHDNEMIPSTSRENPTAARRSSLTDPQSETARALRSALQFLSTLCAHRTAYLFCTHLRDDPTLTQTFLLGLNEQHLMAERRLCLPAATEVLNSLLRLQAPISLVQSQPTSLTTSTAPHLALSEGVQTSAVASTLITTPTTISQNGLEQNGETGTKHDHKRKRAKKTEPDNDST